MQALDVDYYVFSFYKTYGPHFAVLYGKYDKLVELDGLYHYFYGREKVPAKLEPGNTNYELAWGSAGIVDYLDELGGGTGGPRAVVRAYDAITEQETAIGARLLDYLGSRNDIRVVGRRKAGADRVPTISFKAEGRDSAAIVGGVDPHGLGIRFGDFHSRRLVERLGLAGGRRRRAGIDGALQHARRGRPPRRRPRRGTALTMERRAGLACSPAARRPEMEDRAAIDIGFGAWCGGPVHTLPGLRRPRSAPRARPGPPRARRKAPPSVGQRSRVSASRPSRSDVTYSVPSAKQGMVGAGLGNGWRRGSAPVSENRVITPP